MAQENNRSLNALRRKSDPTPTKEDDSVIPQNSIPIVQQEKTIGNPADLNSGIPTYPELLGQDKKALQEKINENYLKPYVNLNEGFIFPEKTYPNATKIIVDGNSSNIMVTSAKIEQVVYIADPILDINFVPINATSEYSWLGNHLETTNIYENLVRQWGSLLKSVNSDVENINLLVTEPDADLLTDFKKYEAKVAEVTEMISKVYSGQHLKSIRSLEETAVSELGENLSLKHGQDTLFEPYDVEESSHRDGRYGLLLKFNLDPSNWDRNNQGIRATIGNSLWRDLDPDESFQGLANLVNNDDFAPLQEKSKLLMHEIDASTVGKYVVQRAISNAYLSTVQKNFPEVAARIEEQHPNAFQYKGIATVQTDSSRPE